MGEECEGAGVSEQRLDLSAGEGAGLALYRDRDVAAERSQQGEGCPGHYVPGAVAGQVPTTPMVHLTSYTDLAEKMFSFFQ